jgi:hypothetical protein
MTWTQAFGEGGLLGLCGLDKVVFKSSHLLRRLHTLKDGAMSKKSTLFSQGARTRFLNCALAPLQVLLSLVHHSEHCPQDRLWIAIPLRLSICLDNEGMFYCVSFDWRALKKTWSRMSKINAMQRKSTK